jgi:hypothetical protein
MQMMSLRTVALCAVSAALAGAGSAALAADPSPSATAPNVKETGGQPTFAQAVAMKCEYARAHDPAIADEVCAHRPPADAETRVVSTGAECVDKPGVPADAAKAATAKAAMAKAARAKAAGAKRFQTARR